MSILSATLLLILVMDPFGNLPVFIAVLRQIPPERRLRVLMREMLIAYAILLAFLLAGQHVLDLLHISRPTLSLAGGVILFLISIRMVFPQTTSQQKDVPHQEPFIVPMATPLIAGPAAMTVLLIWGTKYPGRLLEWVTALTLAWLTAAVVLALSGPLQRLLGDRGVRATERLMGMILVLLAIQMLLDGVAAFLASGAWTGAATQPAMQAT